MAKTAFKLLGIGAAALAVAVVGSLSVRAAPSPSSPPSAVSTPAATSPQVACNRARVAAHDAWAAAEKGLQHQVDSNQAVIEATELNRLPPAWMVPDGTIDRRINALKAAPLLGARIAAVRRAREASLFGAVFARDGAQAVEAQDATTESRKASAAAWEACRDVAPATPPPCP